MPSLSLLAQYLLPKQALTRMFGALARQQAGVLSQIVIRRFIDHYGVDMSEAQDSDPAAYRSFNDFFTRALRPDVRPLADSALICPVDGAVSQLGPIDHGRIIQAKGHDYSATELLGGNVGLANSFRDGRFATIYLSPRDYHRIHMPCTGILKQMVHVPGDLFSVSPATAAGIPRLFARNERVVCVFDAPWGPWVLVLVGATIVGSMATVWHGVVNTERPAHVRHWNYPADGEAITLDKGVEMGRFLLGSTVVMLFPKAAPELNRDWQPGQTVRMGQAMSTEREPAAS